ncbi:MAG: type II toxin-antitoxin system prevent-host-death family antitoxin [Gammaproteobacteria bacterium]
MSWQLHEAKNKLSEVIRRALSEGPQRVTRRSEAVIVIAEKEYQRLTGEHLSLAGWLVNNPMPCELELPAREDPPRKALFQDDLP